MARNIRVGITHGDCNGIGYEVILKALAPEGITDLFTPVIFGTDKVMTHYVKTVDTNGFQYRRHFNTRDIEDGRINLIDIQFPELKPTPGEPSEEAGRAALGALEAAVKALREGDIDVLVTAPIDKSSIHGEGFDFAGHTEYLQNRFNQPATDEGTPGDDKALMILFNDNLRVALVTTHVAIPDIASHITEESVTDTVSRLNESLKRDFRIGRPRIAVLGLNPHCGDHGVAGDHDDRITRPAIETLRSRNIMAFGPFAADGFFGSGAYRNYDGVVAMYHDQGLAPFKTLAGVDGVNYTAGLKYVRTSPDHGTGYDIAGKNQADPTSMRQAIYAAIDIFRARRDYDSAHLNPLAPLPVDKKSDKKRKTEETPQPKEEQ